MVGGENIKIVVQRSEKHGNASWKGGELIDIEILKGKGA